MVVLERAGERRPAGGQVIDLYPKTDANRAHEELRTQVAADDTYRFHVHLIKHGREICKARKPKCETCVVSDICQYRRGLVESI